MTLGLGERRRQRLPHGALEHHSLGQQADAQRTTVRLGRNSLEPPHLCTQRLWPAWCRAAQQPIEGTQRVLEVDGLAPAPLHLKRLAHQTQPTHHWLTRRIGRAHQLLHHLLARRIR